jgi:signal peptidase I
MWGFIFSSDKLKSNIFLIIIFMTFFVYNFTNRFGKFINKKLSKKKNNKNTSFNALKNQKFNKKKFFKNKILTKIFSLLIMFIIAILIRVFILEPFQIPSSSMFPTLQIGDHLFASKINYGLINPLSKKKSYILKWKQPKLGDVVIFSSPIYVHDKADKIWVKRIIAISNQIIHLKNSVFFINKKAYSHILPNKISYFFDFNQKNHISWAERSISKTIEQISITKKYKIYQKHMHRRNPIEANWPSLFNKNLIGITCKKNKCIVDKNYVFVVGDNRGFSSDGRSWGGVHINRIKGTAKLIFFSIKASKNILNINNWITFPKINFFRFFKKIK